MIYEITERVETAINIDKKMEGGTFYLTIGFNKNLDVALNKIYEKKLDIFDHLLITNNSKLIDFSDRLFYIKLNNLDDSDEINILKIMASLIVKVLLYREFDYYFLEEKNKFKINYIKIKFENKIVKYKVKEFLNLINDSDIIHFGNQYKELDKVIDEIIKKY